MNGEQQPQVRHQTVMDDETRHIARVYAEALYRAADRQGLAADVMNELDELVTGVFGADPGLELFLASASISRDRKKHAIESAFTGRASDVLVHFLLVLNEHDRLGAIRGVAQAYLALHNRRTHRVVVQVQSAVPLTDSERARLTDDVRSVAKIEPILQERVEPELLGGLVVRVGDWVYDASVRTRLDTIRTQLIERSSHGIASERDRFGT